MSQHFKHFAAILFFVGLLFVGLYGAVKADNPTEFTGKGFAYGSINDGGTSAADTGIGYISFGCESDSSCDQTNDYGVRINTDPNSSDEGDFFGYAWSSNYGWISFNHNDVSSCGANGGLEITGDVQNFVTPNNTTETQILQGFAKVLNATPGWDGCINFSGMTQMNTAFQTKITKEISGDLTLSGWAWGSPVIGWINFDCEYCEVEFKPNNAPVCPDGTTGTYPDCEPIDCPPGNNDPDCLPSGESSVNLYVGTYGTVTQNMMPAGGFPTLGVTLIPEAVGVGVENCQATYTTPQGTVSGWTNNSIFNPLYPNVFPSIPVSISGYGVNQIVTFIIQCSAIGTGTSVLSEAYVVIGEPVPSVSISAEPDLIELDINPTGDTQLSWIIENVVSSTCAISGEVDETPEIDDELTDWTPGQFGFSNDSPNSSGSSPLSGVFYPVAFTIQCNDFGGTPVSDTVLITTETTICTVSMEEAGYCTNDNIPIFEEF